MTMSERSVTCCFKSKSNSEIQGRNYEIRVTKDCSTYLKGRETVYQLDCYSKISWPVDTQSDGVEA